MSTISFGRHGRPRVFLGLAVTVAMLISMAPTSALGTWQATLNTELVSVATDGTQGNGDSSDVSSGYGGWGGTSAISDDGMYVAFESNADNLAPGDTNGSRSDIYYRDLMSGETTLVSTARVGGISDRGSRSPSMSDDGRYVAFFTGKDLDDDDNNGGQDYYIRDMQDGSIHWVEATNDGTSPADNAGDIEEMELALSGNGRYLVFDSWSDVISPDDGNGTKRDIFIYDTSSQETTIVTKPRVGALDSDRGSRSASISDDGRYVAFWSGQDLVATDTNGDQDLYLKDMQTGAFTLLDIWADATDRDDDVYDIQISGNGAHVVFMCRDYSLLPGDYNDNKDIYLWDVEAAELSLISEPWVYAQEWDRGSRDPQISDDGRFISFFTGVEMVPSDENRDQDLYIHDTRSDTYIRHDFFGNDSSPGDELWAFAMSGDGSRLAFTSDNPRLVDGDTNGYSDVFVRDLNPVLPLGAIRYQGADRYATAVDVSEASFPDGTDTVVIATGENWPDALSGSALAGAARAPMLLTKYGALPANVKAEIERLGAVNVYILGGTDAVSAAVEAELDALLSGFVNRLGGTDRYETSRIVADTTILIGSWDGTFLVATGAVYADALSGAPLAAGLDWPIVLTNPDNGTVYMPAGARRVVILGGVNAVSASTETWLKNSYLANSDVVRLGGATRYETSAMVAEYGVETASLNWNGVGIATGENFPDGLTGGTSLGMHRTVLLLTPTNTLAAAARAKLTEHKAEITTVQFIGGVNALSDSVEAEVKAILGM